MDNSIHLPKLVDCFGKKTKHSTSTIKWWIQLKHKNTSTEIIQLNFDCHFLTSSFYLITTVTNYHFKQGYCYCDCDGVILLINHQQKGKKDQFVVVAKTNRNDKNLINKHTNNVIIQLSFINKPKQKNHPHHNRILFESDKSNILLEMMKYESNIQLKCHPNVYWLIKWP